MNPDPGERRLVDACIDGDVEARQRLATDYYRAVRQAISFLPAARGGRIGATDVEDAVQLAFMTFLARDAQVLRRWEGRAGLRTYLRRVAERVATRHFQVIRTRQGRFCLDLDAPGGAVERPQATQGLSAEAALVADETRTQLRNAVLAQLSEVGRTYYQHLFVEELDATTVAALCETNANNVYQWKNRILRVAHRVLRAHLSDPSGGER